MGKTKNKNRVKPDAENETEERFRAAETRPQFRSVKKHTSKVVLDERFASVLTDARFQLDGKDKYGRKKTEAVKDDLTAFYTVEEGEGEEKKEQRKPSDDDSASNGSSEDDSVDAGPKKEEKEQDEDPASRIAYLKAFSRGEIDVSSSSDEDDSSQSSNDDEDEGVEDPVYGSAGVLDPSTREEEIEITFDTSPYLVVTNMDWANIRAVDLFSILSSFTPPGAVKRVQVYQSDFGKEQMEKEKIYGPVDIWKKKMENASDEDDESDAENSSAADDSENEGDNDDQDSTNNDSEHDQEEKSRYLKVEPDALPEESDFDPEKLRAYETSKLKYYFAVVEFANSESADAAYREVDGLEFENSSSAVDLRALPSEALDNVITDRSMRDEASSIPSNYVPPDFVVSALQQTNVQCTWDQGDTEREKALTKYSSGGWEGAEADDLKTYLASDGSSDEDSGEEGDKGSTMRKLLGLDSDNENDDLANSEKSESSEDDGDSDNEHEGIQGMNKEVKFIPGKKNLEEKIRAKLETKNAPAEELTPWQKYQEKRKEKRRERKQSTKKKKNAGESEDDSDGGGDDFFADDAKPSRKKKEARGAKGETDEVFDLEKSRKELELLLAGENEEEQAKDYDIRGIQRMEKNKDKKLKGGRKRKEEKLASSISGTGFKVNSEDNRFAAVLEGSDDRFGIDKTNPNYKDTSAMREILAEQTQRRKKKRRKTVRAEKIAPDISADAGGKSAGSAALSSLVSRLKSKVSKKIQ
jgi:hypothetical protein